jgi:hypothetical protein
MQLVEEMAESPTPVISLKHFDKLRMSFDAGQFFTDPLRNFDTAEAKYLALICLRESAPKTALSLVALQDLAATAGLRRNIEQIKTLCDELVINNVLMWVDAKYTLATAALSYYARDWGYLDRLFTETKMFLGLGRDSG